MAVRSLARSGIGTGGKYISFLAGNTAYSPDADYLIEEQLIASTTASVTFSSIPSSYKHLQVRMVTRGARTDIAVDGGGYMRFNGDTASNYNIHRLNGYDGVIQSGYGTGTSINNLYSPAALAASSNFGATIIDILDFASTSKYKTIRWLNGAGDGGPSNTHIRFQSGLWLSTSAISSITIGMNESIAAGSRISLYGSNG